MIILYKLAHIRSFTGKINKSHLLWHNYRLEQAADLGGDAGVVHSLPEVKPCSSYSLLKFVNLTRQLRHSFAVVYAGSRDRGAFYRNNFLRFFSLLY